MHMRFCCALLMFSLCPLACSSNSKKHTTPSQEQITDPNNTNVQYDAGAADGGACAEWPASKLVPYIGPFFFGSRPRLCRVDSSTQGHVFFEYNDDYTRITRQAIAATGDITTFTYDASGLITQSLRTTSKGNTTTTFEYSAEQMTQTSTTGSETVTQITHLDEFGYPRELTLSPVTTGQPTRYLHEYVDCHLQRRVAYNSDKSVNDDLSADYSYDDLGRISERRAPKDSSVFVYLDENDECPTL